MLGMITKVQGRVAGREHLLLNHPRWILLGQKDPRTCSNSKSQFNKKTLVSVHCTIVHQLNQVSAFK